MTFDAADEHGITPLALGDNWAYLLSTADGPILIDAGPDYPGSWDALVAQLNAAGCEPRDVRHVAITHAHVDHCGLATRWQQLGATVSGSAAEAPQFLQGSNIIGYAVKQMFEFWRECGVPEARVAGYIEARERVRAAYRAGDNTGGGARRERWPGLIRGTPFTPDRLLGEGDDIRHGGRRIQFIPAPGHTPGNAVYYEPETRILFSGDQVIPASTPTPAGTGTSKPPRPNAARASSISPIRSNESSSWTPHSHTPATANPPPTSPAKSTACNAATSAANPNSKNS